MSKYEVDAAEWAYLQQARANAAARAENARRSAALRAERVRQGVRRAIGRLPANSHSLGHWNLVSQVLAWIAIKGPESFGLQRVPDRRTVREVLDQMAEERS